MLEMLRMQSKAEMATSSMDIDSELRGCMEGEHHLLMNMIATPVVFIRVVCIGTLDTELLCMDYLPLHHGKI